MSGIEIERAINGFELEYCDPEIEAKNQKSSGKWVSPRRKMVFTSSSELLAALKGILDSMPAMETFDTAFDAAVKAITSEEEDDE